MMKKVPMDTAPKASRWITLLLIFALFFGNWGYKLYQMQIVQGESYRTSAGKTGTRTLDIEAARGELLDRNGKELVINTIGRKLVFDKAYMRDANLNEVILNLVNLLDAHQEEWRDLLPIYLDENGEYQFAENREGSIKSIKSYCRLQDYATAQNCVDALVQKYECEQYDQEDMLKIISVRNQMRVEDFSFKYPFTFAHDVSDKTMAVIMENHAEFGFVSVVTTTDREYVQGDLAPHVIGMSGPINAEQYAALKDKGYKITDQIGLFGIESAMEKYLRGVAGKRQITIGVDGLVTEVTTQMEPLEGNSVKLTLDADLQRVVQDALAENVEWVIESSKGLESEGAKCSGAAAVVMDVHTGGILAMASYPSFDLSTYSEDLAELSSDAIGTPLVNRAISGLYPPGSVMKPAVALASLDSGKVSVGEKINCTRIYQRFLPEQFRCLGHHGNIEVKYGLQVSCNIFFYEAAYRMGIDKMNEYCRRLGLGEKTGIEIGESGRSVLAGRAQRESIGSALGWFPGDTIQAAIGQSDNLFTPIQLASYISTIANGGTRYQAHLVKQVVDYNRVDPVTTDKDESPVVLEDLTDIPAEYFKEVQAGMRQAITGGSVAYVLSNYPVPLAGKTGTAQAGKGADHGLLATYAPYEDPEICVVVVLEHGGHGYSAARSVKTIMDAYFKLGDFAEPEEVPEETPETTPEEIPETAPETTPAQ